VANSQAEIDQLTTRGVTITGTDAKPNLLSVVVSFLPWLLLIGFYLFLFRQMQSGGAKAFSFGKSKAKLLTGDTPR
jgi:cell division protease FtsH